MPRTEVPGNQHLVKPHFSEVVGPWAPTGLATASDIVNSQEALIRAVGSSGVAMGGQCLSKTLGRGHNPLVEDRLLCKFIHRAM